MSGVDSTWRRNYCFIVSCHASDGSSGNGSCRTSPQHREGLLPGTWSCLGHGTPVLLWLLLEPCPAAGGTQGHSSLEGLGSGTGVLEEMPGLQKLLCLWYLPAWGSLG